MARRRSAAEVLRVFALSPEPVLTAKEVAEKIDITQQGAYSRLSSLEDDNYLQSKKVGAAARVFWLTQKGRNHVAEEFEA